MLKHRELEICLEMSRMSVRLAVRLRFSVNYDGSCNERENDRSCVTNDIFAFLSLKYKILMITKIFGCAYMFRTMKYA